MTAEDPALADAWSALTAFDWSSDATPLARIDAAVAACHGNPTQTADMERRLGEVLTGATSRAAKEYACRKLCRIGTAASVPSLAVLLDDADASHMARAALERIEAPEAAAALRDAVGRVAAPLKLGMISSLANRRDAAAVPVLAPLLTASGPLAAAAAAALGRIGTPEAAAALATCTSTDASVTDAVHDARIDCADAALARGDRAAAKAIFEAIAVVVGDAPRTHRQRALRVAARSGLIACLDDTVAS